MSEVDCESEQATEKQSEKEKALVERSEEEAWGTRALAATSSRQLALGEDLALAKEIRSEKKEQFYAAASESSAAPASLVVKICWCAAAFAIVLLVALVCHSLLRTQSNDASLEEKIISGDKLEGLKALREHSIQSLFSTFTIVIMMLVLGIFAGFGLLLWFKDTDQHQSKRRMEMVRAATNTFEFSEDLMAQLSANLRVQITTVESLERDVDGYTKQIEKLHEEGSKDKEKIEKLQEEKAKKESELASAQATVRATQKRLDQAKTREEGLKQDLRSKEESLQKEQRESSRARAEASRAQENLRRSEAETSDLRSRARCLEQSASEYRSRAQRLELDNVRLTEEVKRKPSRVTKIWI